MAKRKTECTYLSSNAHYGIVLDTEGYSAMPSYNIGFTVVDLQTLQVVEYHSYAIPEYLEQNLTYNQEKNQTKNLSTMYVNNLHDILKGFNSKYNYKTERGMWLTLQSVIKKYQVRDVFAFNFPFDKSALVRSFGKKAEKLYTLINWHDIQTMTFYTHCNNLHYCGWCAMNGYLTENGNIQTKAETFYRYLFNPDFKEEHTALSDVKAETALLFKALATDRNVKTNHISAWNELKKIMAENNTNPDDLLSEWLFGE